MDHLGRTLHCPCMLHFRCHEANRRRPLATGEALGSYNSSWRAVAKRASLRRGTDLSAFHARVRGSSRYTDHARSTGASTQATLPFTAASCCPVVVLRTTSSGIRLASRSMSQASLEVLEAKHQPARPAA